MSTSVAIHRAIATLARLVRRQDDVLSIIHGFAIALWGAIAGLLLVSLMRAAPPGPLTPGRMPAKARATH